jgi:hypothetical protein
MRMGAIKKFIEFVQEGMPIKIQMIHVLNTNYVFHKGLDLIKIFMKNELMALVREKCNGRGEFYFVENFRSNRILLV